MFGVAALANRPADVVAGQVAHAKRAHGHAELFHGLIDLRGRATFVQQKAALTAVLLDHAVADEAVAHAGHHSRLADFFGHRHDCGHDVLAGLGGAHHLQQLHHVGRAEKVQADHVLRALGESSDLVDVQRGSVRGQDGARLHDAVEFFEDFFLDAHLFKHGFNHHVGGFQLVIAQRGAQQAHALLVLVLLELAFFDLRFVVFADGGDAAVQRVLLHFQQLDGHAGVKKIHGNATTHGAGANDGDGLDAALRCVRRYVGNLGGSTLGHEQMAQGAAFRGPHQVDEELALKQHAVCKFFPGGGFHSVHALGGCRVVFGHALDHVASELKVSIALRVAARQIAHQRQGSDGSHFLRKSQGFSSQGVYGRSHLVKEFLAGDHGQQLAFHGLATDDHVERRLHTQDARQALRAAGTRQEAQLDFGQGHAAARRGNAVVATERQFQPAAHTDGVNRCHHRLGRVLNSQDDAEQIGLGHGFVGAEFLDVGTARKSLAGTGDNDGLHGSIRIGLLQCVSDGAARDHAQAVDRRVVERDDRHAAVNFVMRCHVRVLS